MRTTRWSPRIRAGAPVDRRPPGGRRPVARVILIWGVASEAPLARVRAELMARDAEYVLLEQRRALETGIQLCTITRPEGALCLPDGSLLNLSEVTGVYARP